MNLNFNTKRFDKFFNFFNVPQKPFIGIEPGPSSIKCVELSRSRSGKLRVESIAIEPCLEASFDAHGVVDPDKLGSAILTSWQRMSTKTILVAFAIPTSGALKKRVKMAAEIVDDAKSLEDEVNRETNNIGGVLLDDLHIDWAVTDTDLDKDGNKEVLICAAKKDNIRDYQASMEAAGLTAAVADIDSRSQNIVFERWVESRGGEPEVVAIVDAGNSLLKITVHNRGELDAFVKEVSFGRDHLVSMAMEAYGLDKANAESMTRKPEAADFDTLVLDPFLDLLGNEVSRPLQMFMTQGVVGKIDRILLCGGCSAVKGAAKSVESACGISTSVFDPFEGMEISDKAKRALLTTPAPMLVTACGLALRQFDNGENWGTLQ